MAVADVGDSTALHAAIRSLEDGAGTDRRSGGERRDRRLRPLRRHRRERDRPGRRVNVLGTAHAIRSVVPGMIERRAGHIVTIGSIAGRLGSPFEAIYSASKFAAVGLTEALVVELEPYGIGVSMVQPGPVDTAFGEARGHPYDRARPKPVPAEDVAAAVISAVERGRHEQYVPGMLRPAVAIRHLVPPLFRFGSRRSFTQRAGRGPRPPMRALVFGVGHPAVDAASRRQRPGPEPGHHARGPAGDPGRPAPAPGLGGHPPAAHRHLRVGLQADPPRLRGRQRQRHERAVLVPAGDGPRGGGRGGGARARGRGLRRGPAGGAQPVVVVRAPWHPPCLPGLRRPATSACAGASRPATSAPASTRACRATPPAATPSSCRPTRRCSSRCPTRVDDEHAIFADPFAVSLHSVTRHPPPPGGKVLVWGPAPSARRPSPSSAPCTPTSRWPWWPGSTPKPTSSPSSAPTWCCGSAARWSCSKPWPTGRVACSSPP